MSTVRFTDEGHIYTTDEGKYESVSGLWKDVFLPFDGEEISMKCAYRDIDPEVYDQVKRSVGYFNSAFYETLKSKSTVDIALIQEKASEIRETWVEKAQVGTDFHYKQELMDIKRGYRVNPFDGKEYPIIRWDFDEGYQNQSYPGELIDIPDGYVVEHLVKSDKHRIAGQIDQNYIETINGTRYIDIDDWKGLELGTQIPTPDRGLIPIEDLKEGDQIFNGYGIPTEIVGASNIHYNPCYKIEFSVGESVVADHEHRWVVYRNQDSPEVELTTEELYKGVVDGDVFYVDFHDTGSGLGQTMILSICRVPTVPTRCLAVAGEEKTYLFSKAYIKTHNTDKKISVEPEFFRGDTSSKRMHYPFNHLYSTNYWKYCMKLSTYARFMELQGFVVRNIAFTHVEISPELEILQEVKYQVPYKKFEVDLKLTNYLQG